MRLHSALPLLAACALTCASAVLPRTAGAQSGVLLRYHFATGQKASYKLALTLTGSIPVLAPKLAIAELVPFSQKTVSVYSDGSGQVSYSFTTSTTTLNGQTTTSPLVASAVDRVSPTGKATVITSLGLQNQFGGVLSVDPTIGSPLFPAGAVAVGGQWNAAQHIALGSVGSLSGTLLYTLSSVATVKGHKVATITATGKLPVNLAQGSTQATGTAAVSETILFDTTSGTVSSVNAKIKVVADLGGSTQSSGLPATPITLTLQLKLTRQ